MARHGGGRLESAAQPHQHPAQRDQVHAARRQSRNRRGAAGNGKLVLTISDTGIGIAREDMDLITKPFHRRKAAFDARHQGAGLGLPFAKMVVELHGGSLTLASEPNKGTTVTIALPLGSSAALNHAA